MRAITASPNSDRNPAALSETRSRTPTRAPSSTNRATTARPIPEPPPGSSATLPSSQPMVPIPSPSDTRAGARARPGRSRCIRHPPAFGSRVIPGTRGTPDRTPHRRRSTRSRAQTPGEAPRASVSRRSSRAPAPPRRQVVPALGVHELRPAAVEVPEVVLARPRLGDVHHRARDAEAVPLVVLDLVAQALLVAVGVAPRDGAAAGRVRVVPVLHVVLFRQSGGPGIADVVLAQEVLHLGGRVGVDEIPPPHFRLVRAPRMPHGDRARL